MIKVERLSKPEELTTEVQNKLIEEFKKNKKKSVWNKHFHYKDRYEDEVIDWNNLNPSCPHCNKSKSYHDTYEEPIINPFNDDPKDYFYLKNYRYYSKNDSVEKIASDTIDVLGLNDTQELVINRFTQGDAVIQKIKDALILEKEIEF